MLAALATTSALTGNKRARSCVVPRMIALALWMVAAAPLKVAEVVDVVVVVPLCDGAALACGRGAAGDPRSLDGNLYWGAMYGAERFLKARPGYRVVAKVDPAIGPVLRKVTLERTAAAGERTVHVNLVAFDGTKIDDALTYFFDETAKGDADLVVWTGHDRLMDVEAPAVSSSSTATNVAVLACVSEQYFGPVLERLGAHPVALTRTFMAPEAYLLDALLANAALHGPADRVHLRVALIDAYARFQKITPRAAGSVFSKNL